MKFIVEGASNEAPVDTSLMRLLVRAQKIGSRVFADNAPTLDTIAREEGLNPSYTTRLLRLKFLAPDIVAAIAAGRQPAALTANKLMADTRLPLEWGDQRKALGFA
jgi:site-specific DNA recombinase